VATNTALADVGDRLRAGREQRGLTLEQLSELSGLSKAHLSRLESGERQPSIAALLDLSSALGLRMSELLGEDPGGTPLSLHAPDETRHDADGLSIAPCSGYAGSRALEALRVTVEPNREPAAPARHRGEEWLYVLSGTLELEYADQLHELRAGMSAHFDADRPHRLNARKRPAEILLVAAEETTDLRAIHR
jgi:transcriptional regulator with XRE-family HTH domain